MIALDQLRLSNAHPVPLHLLDGSALDYVLPPLATPKTPRPLRIAVDLDDTLIHNSHTCPELWTSEGTPSRHILPGYDYTKMRITLRGRLQRLSGRARYDTVDRRRHPHMHNPRVIAAPNLAMLSFLASLKAGGATLVLASASAKVRIRHLFSRLPILHTLFGDAVFAAEDLAAQSVRARHPDMAGPAWEMSASVHAARPLSLITKTPWALAPGFDGEIYDYLIDDSGLTADLFQAHGLAERLIAVPGQAFGSRAWDSVAMCWTRIFGIDRFVAPTEPMPMVRFEDPLYWPFIHRTDQFEAPNG